MGLDSLVRNMPRDPLPNNMAQLQEHSTSDTGIRVACFRFGLLGRPQELGTLWKPGMKQALDFGEGGAGGARKRRPRTDIFESMSAGDPLSATVQMVTKNISESSRRGRPGLWGRNPQANATRPPSDTGSAKSSGTTNGSCASSCGPWPLDSELGAGIRGFVIVGGFVAVGK